jgi:hypothetical protein
MVEARAGSVPVSALTGEGLDGLLERVASRLELAPRRVTLRFAAVGPAGDRARLLGRDACSATRWRTGRSRSKPSCPNEPSPRYRESLT